MSDPVIFPHTIPRRMRAGGLLLRFLFLMLLVFGVYFGLEFLYGFSFPSWTLTIVVTAVSAFFLLFVSWEMSRLNRWLLNASAKPPKLFSSAELRVLRHNILQVKERIMELHHDFGAFRGEWTSLDMRLHKEADELNETSRDLSDAVLRSGSAVDELAGAAESSREIAERMNRISGRFTGGVAALNEENRRVAGTVEEAVIHIETIHEAMLGSMEYVKDSAEKMDVLGKRFLEQLRSFNLLTAQILSVDKVLEVIDDIADQTNMLALNAAIEAARSGKYGRGFSIVADEIRNLSVRIIESTSEVKKSIKNMQQRARETLIGLEEGHHITQKTAHTAGESLNKTDLAVKQIESLENLLKKISVSTSQQARESEEMEKVTHVAKELTQTVTAGITEQAVELSHLLEVISVVQQATEKVIIVARGLEEIEKGENLSTTLHSPAPALDANAPAVGADEE